MRLARPSRRPPLESALPMINVTFLLLIFFLMTARIVPEEPVAVTLPEAEGSPYETEPERAYVGADGTFYWQGLSGEAALAALAAGEAERPLALHADKGCDGAKLAALLARIGAARPGPVQLVVQG